MVTTGDTPCSYSCCDVTDDRLSAIDNWECPHSAVEGRDLCIFHLPPDEKDTDEVAQALVEQINQPADGATISMGSKCRTQFIGARLDGLDLEYIELDPNHNFPVDLRDAVVTGSLGLSEMTIDNPLWLSGVRVEGTADFSGTQFLGDPRFVGTIFESDAYFMGARFEGFTEFNSTNFDDRPTRFHETADFRQATFNADVKLGKTIFGGDADFRWVTFRGDATFSSARFEDETQFDDVDFHEDAFFLHVGFESEARFEGVSFEGDVRFANARFVSGGDFRNCTCVGEMIFDPHEDSPKYRIDLRRSDVSGGRFSQTDETTVLYDLAFARIGDVTLEVPEEGSVFDYYRFLDTGFDGFDFSNYAADLLASEWIIHGLDQPVGADGEGEVTPAALEATYLKAKNGASEGGYTEAASEFFQKELRYRRSVHKKQFSDASVWSREGLNAVGRWIANFLFDYSAGYGEKPSRVVGVSIIVIFLFTGLFWSLIPEPPYGTRLGYGILSLESFVALVLRGSVEINSPGVRLLAEIEGFMGAFLVGLFVFTLTRSVHR